MRKSILSCMLIATAVCAISARTLAQTAVPETEKPEYTVDNCIVTFSEEGLKPNKSGSGSEFWFLTRAFSGSNLYVKMSYVDTATALHGSHQHADPEFFYILEGEAVITINGQEKTVGPNTCIFCPPNVPHAIRRANDQPLRYLVVHA